MRTTLFTMIAVLMVGIVPQVNAQVDLTDFVPDDDTVSGQNFTLDGTGSAGSGDIIQLEFGSVLNEYLQFDVDDDRFELSNDLSLEGAELQDFRVENLASDPVTCSGGVSGRLYFNTGSNELQLCDGSSWGGVSGSGGVVDQTNVVYVDGTRAAQTGEVYNTLAAAVSYINTQSPGSGNPWVILIEPGTNAENVTIPTYTVLVGRDRESTTLTGTITLSANSALQNLTVNGGGEVDIANGTTGYITSSDVNIDDGASGGIDGTLVISESFVDGVIGATGVVQAYESIVGPSGLTNNGSLGTYHSSVLTLTNNNIWNNFATAYDNSVLSAGSQLNATTTQEAIDELVEQGTPNTIWTLDKNNAGSGVNVDIVANQGSDNDGTLRYNATTNQWEISNDGGSFQSIATGSAAGTAEYFDAYNTVSTSVSNSPTYTDVPLNTQRKITSDYSHSAGSAIVTVNATGTYIVTYSVTTAISSGAARSESESRLAIDTGSGFTVVSGSIGRMYNRNNNQGESTATRTLILDLTSGDQLKVQVSRISGSDTIVTVAGGSSLTLARVEGVGAQGPQGPAGADGSNTVSLQDEGVNVASTPHAILNFVGGSVSVSDAGSGVATVSISDNANTIDTLDSSQFLRSDTNDSFTSGTLSLLNGTTFSIEGVANIGDGGDAVAVNSNTWDVSTAGVATGFTGITSSGVVDFGAASSITISHTNSSIFTLDNDETGNPDVDVDIVAEQGTELNGTLRYDDGNNRWELSNNGAAFSPIRTGFFGTQYQYAESESVSTTTSTSFQQKLRLSTATLPAGTYRIGWSYQWNHDSTSNGFEARVQIDDVTEIMYHQQEPQDSGGSFGSTGTDQKHVASGFKHIALTAGSHFIDLDYLTNNGFSDSSIWNARIEIWRVQ